MIHLLFDSSAIHNFAHAASSTWGLWPHEVVARQPQSLGAAFLNHIM